MQIDDNWQNKITWFWSDRERESKWIWMKRKWWKGSKIVWLIYFTLKVHYKMQKEFGILIQTTFEKLNAYSTNNKNRL